MESLTPRIDKLDSNLLINSRMSFWQRGTSLASVSSGYLADRFGWAANYPADITRNSDVPSNQADYSYNLGRISTFTPTSVDGGRIFQAIEGNVLRQIRGGKFTLFFWAKSSKVGVRYAALTNGALTRSFLQRYEITQANVWQSFQFQLTHDETGSWNYDNSAGMVVNWATTHGSNYFGSPGVWQTGVNILSANDAVNLHDAANSYLRIALPVVMPGHVVLDPLNLPLSRTYSQELRLCQRYYEKSYNLETNPGSVVTVGATRISTTTTSGAIFDTNITFNVRKRASPSVQTYSTFGTVGFVRNTTSSIDVSSTVDFVGESTSRLVFTSANAVFSYHFTADAEL